MFKPTVCVFGSGGNWRSYVFGISIWSFLFLLLDVLCFVLDCRVEFMCFGPLFYNWLCVGVCVCTQLGRL